MKDQGYVSMSELVKNISAKLEALEKGQLPAEEIDQLVSDSRELNERLVVLRFKAWEKQLITKQETPVAKKEEERVIEGFKISLGESFTPKEEIPVNQMNLVDAIAEEERTPSAEVKKDEPLSTGISTDTSAKKEIPALQPDLSIEVSAKVETHNQKPGNSEPVSHQDLKSETVNEKLSSNQPTLAEKLQKKPIADLKTAIGLNQKFLFMNDLFEGENGAYNEAVNKLNSFSSVDDAKNYLLELGTRYKWTLENENVLTFTDLVERRYA